MTGTVDQTNYTVYKLMHDPTQMEACGFADMRQIANSLVAWAYKSRCGVEAFTIVRACVGIPGGAGQGREQRGGAGRGVNVVPAARRCWGLRHRPRRPVAGYARAYPPLHPCRLAGADNAVAQSRQHRPHVHPLVSKVSRASHGLLCLLRYPLRPRPHPATLPCRIRGNANTLTDYGRHGSCNDKAA